MNTPHTCMRERGRVVNVLFKRIKKFSISMNLHTSKYTHSDTAIFCSVKCEPKHAVVYGLNYNICVSICVVNAVCFNAVVVVIRLLLTEYHHVHCSRLWIREWDSFTAPKTCIVSEYKALFTRSRLQGLGSFAGAELLCIRILQTDVRDAVVYVVGSSQTKTVW